jgi:hypothetical protein
MMMIIAITVCLWWAVVPQLFCKPSKSAGFEIVDLPALSSYFTNPPIVLPPAACLLACCSYNSWAMKTLQSFLMVFLLQEL